MQTHATTAKIAQSQPTSTPNRAFGNPDSALEDRLCTHLSAPSHDHPISIRSISSSSCDSQNTSVLSRVPDLTHSANSSALIERKPRFKEDLDWCCRKEITDNLSLFDEDQRHLVRSIVQKQDHYPEGFEKGNYFQSIYPIIASGYTEAEQIVFCGARCSYGGRPCRRWQLCSRCAYYRGSRAFQRYGVAFAKTTFAHLTCSFDGSMPLDVTNSSDLQSYWKGNECAIRQALADGLIDGAYIVHELAILSFLPLRVLPHSHVLISGDPLTVERQDAIAEYIADAEGVELEPSLQARTLNTKKDFDFVIRYQTKAIKLKEPYDTALTRNGRHRIRELNLEMKNFLDAFSAATVRFPKIVRIGNLHPQRTRLYIGMTKKEADKAERARKKRVQMDRRLSAHRDAFTHHDPLPL